MIPPRWDLSRWVSAAALDSEFDVTQDTLDRKKLRENVAAKWQKAIVHPVPATDIPSSEVPGHEMGLTGDDLVGDGKGLDRLPISNNTPGFDTAPYFSAGLWVTKAPDTGRQNFSQNRVILN